MKLIQNCSHPITISRLVEDLRQLGLGSADTVLIHSSLSALGWVVGGAQAVVEALCQVVLPQGTLVMPTHSSQFTEPRHWQNPPVPQSWWETIRDHVPAYDPHLTPTCGMGAIVECFRHVPKVFRSSHPTLSFAAVGPLAQTILRDHVLEDGLGEFSPLGALARLDAKVLLLGVGFDSCTMLHLAEAKAEYKDKGRILQGSAIIRDGQRQWVAYYEQNYNSDDFFECGEAFLQAGHARTATVGQGRTHLFSARALLEFAVPWFEENRNSMSLDSTP
ncbi:MAG: AAC(3) family N-acetyltransferase [Candidatus Cloacimonetes bacterium]|nr:AAC(3) family N-acetyltransferase [Candidatus Cloacimonadota bacterium]